MLFPLYSPLILLRRWKGVERGPRIAEIKMNKRRLTPELALTPSDAIDEYVFRVPQSQTDRPSVLVALATVLIVPQLALAIEQGRAEAAHANIRASYTPGRASTGIRDRKTTAQPVLDISRPAQRAVDLDIDVVERQRVHDLANVEHALRQHNLAVRPALLEGL